VYFLAAAPSVRIITEPDVNLQPLGSFQRGAQSA
jgi:hypothetical protein